MERENEAPAERDFQVSLTKLSLKTCISLGMRLKEVGGPTLRMVRSRWLVQSSQVVPPSLARQSLGLPSCARDRIDTGKQSFCAADTQAL